MKRVLPLLSMLLSLGTRGGLAGQQVTAPLWRLPAAPVITVGGADQPDVELNRVGSLDLRDGRLLIANGDPPQLIVVDLNGTITRRLGRAGSGPGEFGRVGWAAFLGDTVVAFDAGSRRLIGFLPDGKPVTFPPVPSGGSGSLSLYLDGRLACGNWLAPSSYGIGGGDSRTSPVRDTMYVTLLSPGLERVVQRLGPFLGVASMGFFVGEGSARSGVVGISAFSPVTLSGVSDSMIYTMDTATPDLDLWDCRGQRRSRITVPIPERPVTPSAVERVKQKELAVSRVEMARRFVDTRYSAANLPRVFPRVRSIVSGPGGELWLEQYEADPEAASTWWVLALSGRVTARLQTPAGFRIKGVTRTHVAGVHYDADGVESIRVYRLSR